MNETVEAVRSQCDHIEQPLTGTGHSELVLLGFNPPIMVLPTQPLAQGDTMVFGAVARFVIEDPSIRTPEGLGAGSLIGDVRRALGEFDVVNTLDEGYEVAPRIRRGISFTFYGHFGPEFLGGWNEEMVARRPQDLPDSVRIQRVNAWADQR